MKHSACASALSANRPADNCDEQEHKRPGDFEAAQQVCSSRHRDEAWFRQHGESHPKKVDTHEQKHRCDGSNAGGPISLHFLVSSGFGFFAVGGSRPLRRRYIAAIP